MEDGGNSCAVVRELRSLNRSGCFVWVLLGISHFHLFFPIMQQKKDCIHQKNQEQ